MHIVPESISSLSPDDQVKFVKFGLGSSYTPPFATVHAAFEHQVSLNPTAIAVEHDGESVTYLELKQMSDRVAVALKRAGVKAGDRVLLLVQRSIFMVAAMLGILKAGAAYVPQDGGIVTDSTLAHIIPDASIGTVLCLRKFASRLPGSKILSIEEIVHNSAYNLPVEVTGESSDSAYAIYTSGTTGKPKGVDVTHLSVVNLLLADPGRVGMRPGRRVAQLLNVAFDMAQWECLGSVSNGCTLCIRGSDWKRVMSSVEIVIATPSVMQLYDPVDYPNIRFVATAGEPCPKPLADRLAAAGVAYYNSCGPTEVTIVNTMTPLPHSVGDEMNIGKPLPNNTVYVLDEELRPLPIGETGIMWGGGNCAARGYIGLPELTAKKFRHDPFLNDGRLMFNTGDLGKWREDGALVHLGRADDQVKIKGFRVELDGVSASLEATEGVHTACALLIDKELVGFVYPATADIGKIQEACAKVQPYYARPTRYIKLETVPKTANGKIDKRALRALAEGFAPAAATTSTPSEVSNAVASMQTASSKLAFSPFVAVPKQVATSKVERHISTASVGIGNLWAQLQESQRPPELPRITNKSFTPFVDTVASSAPSRPSKQLKSFPSSSSLSSSSSHQEDDKKHDASKETLGKVVVTLPGSIPSDHGTTATEKGGNVWDGYLDDELPKKNEPRTVRNLRHIVFSLYRRLFGIVFVVNVAILIHALAKGGLPANHIGTIVVGNICGAVLMRQDYVLNCIFNIACAVPRSWPLAIRRVAGRVYHHGGAHSGCGISAIMWLIYFTIEVTRDIVHHRGAGLATVEITYVVLLLLVAMVGFAYPKRRSVAHDTFERTHRFMGWTATGLVWALIVLLTNDYKQPGESLAYALRHNASFWMICIITAAIISSWIHLRKVNVRSVVLSNHAIRLYFDYANPKTGHFVRLSTSPLTEWHSFATIQEPGLLGFSVVVSRAGDWTDRTITNPPKKLWVRGVPTFGVLRIVPLFRRMVIVATGSGIGPCAPAIFEKRTPMRLLWTSPDVRKTFGDELVDKLLEASPDAVIYDTRKCGKPDMVKLTLRLVREFEAEAVAIISNQKLTEKVVYGMMSRGIPAFGAIWDS